MLLFPSFKVLCHHVPAVLPGGGSWGDPQLVFRVFASCRAPLPRCNLSWKLCMILRAWGRKRNRSAAQCQPVISAVNLPWLRRNLIWLAAVCPFTLGLLCGGVTSCTTLSDYNFWLEPTRREVRVQVETGPELLQRLGGGLSHVWLRSSSSGNSNLTWFTVEGRPLSSCLLCTAILKWQDILLSLFNASIFVCNTVFK